MKSQDQTVTQKTEIPQYIEDFTRNTLDRAGTISDQPYVPYTGDRLAGFTPAQLQAWANTQAQQGQGQAIQDYGISTAARLTGYMPPVVNSQTVTAERMNPAVAGSASANAATARAAQISPAEAAAARAAAASSGYATAAAGERAAAARASGAQAKYEQTRATDLPEFMNPFTQSVIDTTLAQLGRENTQLQNTNDAAAAKAGAFGGSRHGVVEAETNRGYLDTAARTTAGLNAANYAQALAAAQQNTGLRQQTTLTNADRATQASIASAANEQSANNLNAQLSQNLNLYNAGNQQQSLLSNAGFQQQANLANSQNALQVALANAGYRQQTGLFNAGNQQQANLFNAGNQQQSLLANAGYQQQAGLANQDARLRADLANQGAALSAMQSNQNAANTAAGLQLNAGQLAGQLGMDRQRMNAYDNAALEAIGQQQQQQAQRGLDIGYENFLREQQYPIDMLNLRLSAAGATPYGQTSTTTQPITSNWGSTALGLGTLALGVFSDRRMKTDIKRVGTDPDTKLPMYAYRYKGDPKHYPKIVGPMAQDVEKKYPGSVVEVGGKKVIKFQPPNPLAGKFSRAA